jgi:transposase
VGIRGKRVGVDETSVQRRHAYGAIVTDLDEGRVLRVAADRVRVPRVVLRTPGRARSRSSRVVVMDTSGAVGRR